MKNPLKTALLAGTVALGGYWFWSGTDNKGAEPSATNVTAEVGPIVADIKIPASFSPTETMGQTAYNAVCAACHGANGGGRQGMGPPFINAIYQPGHHGDMAFQVAVQNGVRAHHWPFGNMPAQQGLTRSDVANIVAYVRAMQRANGIE